MAGFLKRIFGHFGFFKDDNRHADQSAETSPPAPFGAKRVVKGRVPVPVVSECTPGAGGVQGLQWYAEKLMMDEDGDVAQEFLKEVVSQPSCGGSGSSSNFEVKSPAKPVKLKGPLCTLNGNVHQSVESSSGVHWS
ncbi:hypothetical protein GOP47_0006888 [Adiantum capillus-veneris]|uniref:Uncharacterized protein n=1 Tax=Adiantum capillus-veneris TaxID=13818 RepID=A0A9D4V4G8_ADICA|nr:hypothetical protein GOP47_0006888 [Adiantum capillus-veneris]